jgi:transcriptional regulator with XRE-family HTH domain
MRTTFPVAENPWQSNLEALGQFIHTQRKLAHLSLRELSAMSDLSNAYLSQLERGLHEPSMRAMTQIAKALNLSTEEMLRQAGMLGDEEESAGQAAAPAVSAEAAIRADPTLSEAQKEALLAVYRSFGSGGEPDA